MNQIDRNRPLHGADGGRSHRIPRGASQRTRMRVSSDAIVSAYVHDMLRGHPAGGAERERSERRGHGYFPVAGRSHS
jgi:hypothetical protein